MIRSDNLIIRKLIIGFLLLCLSTKPVFNQESGSSDNKWCPKYDFNITDFTKPSKTFLPFTRWWWPGNAVTKEELKREINLFSENGFGGVEIQPLNLFVPGAKEIKDKAITWDSPGYYENLQTVMEEARKQGIIVDMTDGSGWPPANPQISIEEGFKTLAFSSVDIKAGGKSKIPLPAISNNSGIPARLVTVLAAKVKSDNGEKDSKVTLLDSTNVVLLSESLKNDTLFWKVPEGNWKIIAFWRKPSGERGMTATPEPCYVMDHFDSLIVKKSFNYLFGSRTGLQKYYGNPMRSVFDDSYEFQVDRHFSDDFITYFRQRRGYDITPWLPAQMQKRYNYVSFMQPVGALPDFSFSAEDWRLRYDYDLTLSELFGQHFLKTAKSWTESRGLIHRTQIYGLKNLDIIALTGLVSQPETESMLGSEANLKIMTSGAHVHNRPVISAESAVFNGRAYTNTPQMLRIAVDKLFAAGVNQIIFHGIPYRYAPSELGQEGWYPFSTPLMPMVNFSSNLGEGNIFWLYQKDVNEYIGRTQYALRSGKPHTDVLIYLPLFDMDGMPSNPDEIFDRGYINDKLTNSESKTERPVITDNKWAKVVYLLINQLEASGISWEWVNDESLQIAELTKDNQINIRGNLYQALILANDSIIQLKTAKHLIFLASQGMKALVVGTAPRIQPSCFNWKENDRITAQYIESVLKTQGCKKAINAEDVQAWIKKLSCRICFNGQYHFIRQVQREMENESWVQFIWNTSNQWQNISLTLDKIFKESYWLNAEDGSVIKNARSTIAYQIPPYSSIILFASTEKILRDSIKVSSPFNFDDTNEIISLTNWDLKTDSLEFNNIHLFDWKTNDKLKYSSSQVVYRSSFMWNKEGSSDHFYLDLGKVCYTAEVWLNGKIVGTRIFSPFVLEVTPLLKDGLNRIEITLIPGQLNGFIGKANHGDRKYNQFKGRDDQLMSAGLIGPVVIRK